MHTISFEGQNIKCRDNETLLDAFFRNRIDVPFSCRNGSCQACMIHVDSGKVEDDFQKGLSQDFKDKNLILPCLCHPVSDMSLSLPVVEDCFLNCKIIKISKQCKNINSVWIQIEGEISPYKTGQFVNILSPADKKIRSYSLTSIYNSDPILSFDVQIMANGRFSHWIDSKAKPGDELKIIYPLGNCFHSKDLSVSGKIIISTGSGLGAALAIAKEALLASYSKPIHLHHSVKNSSGFYKIDDINLLSLKYKNFHYHPSTSESQCHDKNIRFGYVDKLAFENHSKLSGWEVYLYGNPIMVKSSIKKALYLRCSSEQIHSDAFETGGQVNYNKNIEEIDSMEFIEEKKVNYDPKPMMWEVLTENNLLNKILDHFYTKVLSDSRLSPFFKGVTKEHIIGKQYAFLNQIYTGKDCYFGDRPRNAHHWMVISDSLFDYREKLFSESCINKGLKEPYLSQLLSLNESFRNSIVKSRPWPRIINGEILPIKGFDEMTLDIGSVCDGCHRELNPGDTVHYHNHTGEMFCVKCKNNEV